MSVTGKLEQIYNEKGSGSLGRTYAARRARAARAGAGAGAGGAGATDSSQLYNPLKAIMAQRKALERRYGGRAHTRQAC